MDRLPAPLAGFLRDLDRLARACPAAEEFLPRLAENLHRLLMLPDALPAAFLRPRRDHYGRYLIRRDPRERYVVVALAWGEQQFTPIHDHGSWSLVGVYQNLLQVTNYLRLDDRSVPGRAKLVRRDTNYLGRGSVAFVFPPLEEIHRVGNPYPGDAVCLNIYGREVEEVNCFDLEAGTVRTSDPLVYHNLGHPVPAKELPEPFPESSVS